MFNQSSTTEGIYDQNGRLSEIVIFWYNQHGFLKASACDRQHSLIAILVFLSYTLLKQEREWNPDVKGDLENA